MLAKLNCIVAPSAPLCLLCFDNALLFQSCELVFGWSNVYSKLTAKTLVFAISCWAEGEEEVDQIDDDMNVQQGKETKKEEEEGAEKHLSSS